MTHAERILSDERAALALWRWGTLDTLDIARRVNRPEHWVARVLHDSREEKRRLAYLAKQGERING